MATPAPDASFARRPRAEALLRGVAIASAGLALALAALVVADYVRLRTTDPLNSPALATLRSQLRERPDDAALREQIRALDLLARRAYFTHTWQVRTGGALLFVCAVSCVLACKALGELRRPLPAPARCPAGDDPWAAAARSRRWLAGLGLGLAAACTILALTDHSRLDTGSTPVAAPPAPGPVAAAPAPVPATGQPTAPVPLPAWPGFRGPGGNGHGATATPPLDWDVAAKRNVLWQTALDRPGFNSPVVAGQRVFLSGADADVREMLCFDADTGALLWRHEVKDVADSPAAAPTVTDDTGYAAPSVACDGARVFALFANGDLAAVSVEGQPLWSRNLGQPQNHYGHSSSLLTDGRRLFVQYDHGEAARLLALNPATGATEWSVLRQVETSWASPVLIHNGARELLVLNAAPRVIAYDPATGEEVWQAECMSGEVAPSPAYADGLLFVAQQYAKLAALRADCGAVAWETDEPSLPDVASPLAANGLLFLAASDGVLTCLDAAAGEVKWTQEFPKGFYASPVLAGDTVVAIDMGGTAHLFKASATYEALGTAAVGEMVVATPAPVGRRLYVRGAKHLFCLGE